MGRTPKKQSLIEEAARQAAETALAEREEREGGLPTPQTEERLEAQEFQSPLADDDLDIFAWVERHIERTGDGVRYYVYRNNELLTTLSHPCSWEEIQSKLGGGHFRVQAKSATTGSYLKQERKSLAEPLLNRERASSVYEESAPEPQAPMVDQTLAYMMKMEEMRRADAREAEERREEARRRDEERRAQEAKEKAASQQTLLATIAGILTPVIQQVLAPKHHENPETKMMLEFLKETTRTQGEQMKEMMGELRRLAEGPKDKGMTTFELMKQLREAEKDGFERAKTMFDMIEVKAEERAEVLSEKGGEDSDDLAKTLIKSFAPAVGPLLAQAARPELPAPVTEHRANVTPLPVRQAAPVQARPAQTAPRANLPKTVEVTGTPVNTVKPGSPIPQSRVGRGGAASPGGSSDEASLLRKRIEEIATPLFGNRLIEMGNTGQVYPPEAMAQEVIQACGAAGIPRDQLAAFRLADLHEIIRKHGLPESVHPWFNQVYAHLNPQAAVDSGVAPTGS